MCTSVLIRLRLAMRPLVICDCLPLSLFSSILLYVSTQSTMPLWTTLVGFESSAICGLEASHVGRSGGLLSNHHPR